MTPPDSDPDRGLVLEAVQNLADLPQPALAERRKYPAPGIMVIVENTQLQAMVYQREDLLPIRVNAEIKVVAVVRESYPLVTKRLRVQQPNPRGPCELSFGVIPDYFGERPRDDSPALAAEVVTRTPAIAGAGDAPQEAADCGVPAGRDVARGMRPTVEARSGSVAKS
jgi:hypothetical protein